MAKIARKTRVGKVIIIGNPDRPRATIEIIEVRGRNVSFVYRGEYSIEIDDIPDSLANHWKTRHNSRDNLIDARDLQVEGKRLHYKAPVGLV